MGEKILGAVFSKRGAYYKKKALKMGVDNIDNNSYYLLLTYSLSFKERKAQTNRKAQSAKGERKAQNE